MRYEFCRNNLPVGYVKEVKDNGQTATISNAGFVTAKDEEFYNYMRGFQTSFLQQYIESGGNVSQIDHCLVLISKDQKVTVYIDELNQEIVTIGKRSIQAGEKVYVSDIAGITELNFTNLDLPSDCGIAFYFSYEWKRGLFYDYRPLHDDVQLNNINKTLGNLVQYFIFTEVFDIRENTEKILFEEGWFYFVSMIGGPFEGMISFINSNITIDVPEQQVFKFFSEEVLNQLYNRVESTSEMKPHLPFVKAGIERYLKGDYISAVNNVWPRIEGILRYMYTGTNKVGQVALLNNMRNVVSNNQNTPVIFFPEKFRQYLESYYFKNFDMTAGDLDVGRHSIGHGVSDAEDYTKKKALIGILIVDQLSYYLGVK